MVEVDGGLVSYNDGAGISIDNSSDIAVMNVAIGENAAGTPSGNTGSGIEVDGSTNVTIGGNGSGSDIAHNDGNGVLVTGSSDDVTILGNRIHSNGALGIDLGNDGPTSNDPNDADLGPNELLNFPEITAITASTVEVDIDAPSSSYIVEVFVNDVADGSGFGEGQTRIATFSMGHAGGTASYSVPIGTVPPGKFVSAKLTENAGAGVFGSTSEFSEAVEVMVDLIVNSTGDLPDANPGDGFCDTGALNAVGDPECTLRAAIAEANFISGQITPVEFDIPVADVGHNAGVWTIQPSTVLPPMTEGTDLRGESQPGWVNTPVIEIDGSAVSGCTACYGLQVNGDNSQVHAIAIHGFNSNLIRVNAEDVRIFNSHIGVSADGTTVVPMPTGPTDATGAAVRVLGDEAIIGSVAMPNVIGGARTSGIEVSGGTGHVIVGNLIGVLPDGSTAPNGTDGITAIGEVGISLNTIAHNGANGVTVVGANVEASIRMNEIFDNGALGIDLGNDGPTANDPVDLDSGPNGLLNTLTIDRVEDLGGGTVEVHYLSLIHISEPTRPY